MKWFLCTLKATNTASALVPADDPSEALRIALLLLDVKGDVRLPEAVEVPESEALAALEGNLAATWVKDADAPMAHLTGKNDPRELAARFLAAQSGEPVPVVEALEAPKEAEPVEAPAPKEAEPVEAPAPKGKKGKK